MRNTAGRRTLQLVPLTLLSLIACSEAAGPRPVATATTAAVGTFGATPVTACGTVLQTPGSYILTEDLLGCPGDGIGIAGDSITLDLNGHRISGAPGSSIGVFVSRASAGRNGYVSHVLVVGPGTIETFSCGLKFQEVRGSRAEGVTVRLNLHGISVNRGQVTGKPSIEDTLVNNIAIDNTAHGFTLNGAREVLFEGNTSNHNGYGVYGGHGFYLYESERITLRQNQINNNQDGGIAIMWGMGANRVIQNVVYGNGRWSWTDLWDGNRCGVTTYRNNQYGTANIPCAQ
jgi:parallel beta-helix repeat protein